MCITIRHSLLNSNDFYYKSSKDHNFIWDFKSYPHQSHFEFRNCLVICSKQEIKLN